jgi:hypothetical protein
MNDPSAGMLAGLGIGVIILALAFLALFIFALWRVFDKTGRHGALSLVSLLSIIPIAGTFVMLGLIGFLALGRWPKYDN